MMPASGIFLVLALLSHQSPDSVYGVVRDAVSGAPLAGVEVRGDSSGPAVLSSASGLYALPDSSAVPLSVHFEHAGYQPLWLEAHVGPGASLRLDVALDPLPVSLPVLEVAHVARGSGPSFAQQPRPDSLDIGSHDIAADALRSNPLIENDDPMLASGIVSGPAPTGFLTALHVHGGAGDQNQVLLDGLPVFGVAHIGGAAGIINPDAIADVRLHSAVPPAEYGGRLSSVMDVRLRSPTSESMMWRGAVDARAVRQLIEVPAGSHGSLLLSGTQNYRGIFAQDGYGLEQNGFDDVLARAALSFSRDSLKLYVFSRGDRLTFPATAGVPLPSAEQVSGPANHFAWSGRTLGLVWSHSGGGATATTRIWQASARAGAEWLGGGVTHLSSSLQETGVSTELLAGGSDSWLRIGASAQRTAADYVVSSDAANHFHSSPLLLAAFAENHRAAGPLLFSAGVRATSIHGSRPLIEPRLSIRYRLSPAVTLAVGAARLHQFVQSMRNEESLLDYLVGAELPVAVGVEGLAPARSDQVTAELGITLTHEWSLSLDGYARGFTGLLAPSLAGAAPFALALPPTTSGSARGAELLATYRGRRTALIARLGVAESQRQYQSGEFDPRASPSGWMSLGVSRRLGSEILLRFNSSMVWGETTSVYAGGLEWQSPGGLASSGEISGSPDLIVGRLDGTELPTYYRSDLGLLRDWHVWLGRRPGLLTTSVTVSNLFGQHNVLGYVIDSPGGPRRPIAFPARSLTAQVAWGF
jgi:hypothetical protein